MSLKQHEFHKDDLEPRALERLQALTEQRGMLTDEVQESVLTHSSALSLKRIADALSRLADVNDELIKDSAENIAAINRSLGVDPD